MGSQASLNAEVSLWRAYDTHLLVKETFDDNPNL